MGDDIWIGQKERSVQNPGYAPKLSGMHVHGLKLMEAPGWWTGDSLDGGPCWSGPPPQEKPGCASACKMVLVNEQVTNKPVVVQGKKLCMLA